MILFFLFHKTSYFNLIDRFLKILIPVSLTAFFINFKELKGKC